MKKIAVIGSGYVGLVTGACFAELGNSVVCVDSDPQKLLILQSGKIPFFEPGLEELVQRNRDAKRLCFARTIKEGTKGAQIVFIAVGTPMGDDGHADLSHVRKAAQEIAKTIDGPKIVVNKSTVPVETGDLVSAIVREHNTTPHEVHVVSNPEFLREGSAVADFMEPDRVVVGVSDAQSERLMRELYAPLGTQMIVTDVRTAEMIKYTANSFLATKISFINEIANICERVGADVKDVVAGIGTDKRIGPAFFNAGIGFGGSCFPKDVTALSRIASASGVEPRILEAVLEVNAGQIRSAAERLDQVLGSLAGKSVAVLGLAFKPNTDDVRESPAVALVKAVVERGGRVIAHDPAAMQTARDVLGDRIRYALDALDAAQGADAVVIATDWNEYKQIDLDELRAAMSGNVLFDGRNLYDPGRATDAGFVYLGFGRRRASSAKPAWEGQTPGIAVEGLQSRT